MPHTVHRYRAPIAAAVLLLTAQIFAAPAKTITPPKQQFGHEIGDDYFLANYTQLTEYWQKLDSESDRMKLVSTSARPPRGATQLHGDHHVAGEHQEARSLQGDLARASRSPRG